MVRLEVFCENYKILEIYPCGENACDFLIFYLSKNWRRVWAIVMLLVTLLTNDWAHSRQIQIWFETVTQQRKVWKWVVQRCWRRRRCRRRRIRCCCCRYICVLLVPLVLFSLMDCAGFCVYDCERFAYK